MDRFLSKILYLSLISALLLSKAGVPAGAVSFPYWQPDDRSPDGLIYYVSSTGGSDLNDGLSPGEAFATVGKVNSLALNPGDQVLFKCGDVWRGDPLVITASGLSGQPVVFSSYPAGCANRPVLSGALPVSGWSLYSGNIYSADLGAGANAGKFPLGVNQLFRGEQRLLLGRWPNLDEGDGYSEIDGQPDATHLSDSALPAANWSGAVAHIKGMRWYILNRVVGGSAGSTLALESGADCWGGSCQGWGYFLNNHLATLDRGGEWFYDAGTGRLYLVSTSGTPADGEVEASAVLNDDDRAWGGVQLGEDLLGQGIGFVTVQNLEIRRWFRDGIASPTNYAHTELHDIQLLDNLILDVDGTGIHLATWVYDAWDGRPDGWRGGYSMWVQRNRIERANRMGIDLYSRGSTFSHNTILDVGRVENLGAAGMGCGYDSSGGYCTEDGDGIRVKIDKPADTGNSNTFEGNRLERIAYNGIDVSGYGNSFTHNVILQACFTKGDCGAVRTFGSGDLGSTPVHDLDFTENIFVDVIGNTDGCRTDFRTLFGFGFYIDHFSRNVILTGNTVIDATSHGILYADSTGTANNNTLYNNGRGMPWSAQFRLGDAPAGLSELRGNVLYSLSQNVYTLNASNPGLLGTSDENYFFHPYWDQHIQAGGSYNLAGWQAASGKDTNSKEAWFSLDPGDPSNSVIFYNDSDQPKNISLGTQVYQDLDQNLIHGSITLQPYRSQVLVYSGEAADLSLEMTLLGAPQVLPGALVSYTLTVSYLGSLSASGVTLSNPLPGGLTGTGWKASEGGVSQQAGPQYTWNLPDLAPGSFQTITVTAELSGSLPAGTPLLITGAVTTSMPDVDMSNNQAYLLLGDWLNTYLPLARK